MIYTFGMAEAATDISASHTNWHVALASAGIGNELVDRIIESIKRFSDSYNRALVSLQSLAALPVEVHDDSVRLPHWDSALRPDSGDCVDLAVNLLDLWRREGIESELSKAGVQIYYCEGTELQFFNSDRDNHAFIGLGRAESDEAKVIVDPALQFICQYRDRGYTLRIKAKEPKLNRSPGREIRITDLADDTWRVVDFLDAESAVVGLTGDRQFAISLGFVRFNDKLRPFLVVAQGKSRGIIFLSFESDNPECLLAELGDISDTEGQELNELAGVLKKFRFLSARLPR